MRFSSWTVAVNLRTIYNLNKYIEVYTEERFKKGYFLVFAGLINPQMYATRTNGDRSAIIEKAAIVVSGLSLKSMSRFRRNSLR